MTTVLCHVSGPLNDDHDGNEILMEQSLILCHFLFIFYDYGFMKG